MVVMHKGYTAQVHFETEDGVLAGRLAGIRDGVSFHADSLANLEKAFHEAVDDYLDTCRKIGKLPQR